MGMALIEGANPPAEGATFGIVALPERLPEPLRPFAPFGARALVPDGMTVVGRWKKE